MTARLSARWGSAATLLVLALSAPAVASDITIGRWCDRMAPNLPDMNREITIRVTTSGQPEVHSRFGDGSSGTNTLIEQDASTYLVEDSPSGDRYRIVAATGELQLIDNDGLIRVARRLENEPRVGDCIP